MTRARSTRTAGSTARSRSTDPQSNPERGADIIVTFPWSSLPNSYGVPGRAAFAGGGTTGPSTGPASEHGSFSPWDIHNTLLAWGPDFKTNAVSDAPAGNVDIAPTVLALQGVNDGKPTDGRVLTEALAGQRAPAVEYGARVFRAGSGAVQISSVGGKWYVDKAWANDTPPLATAAPGDVGGTVPATLSLSLGGPATFSPFIPGVSSDYTASTTANVISSAGDATLTVTDPSTTAPNRLVNGMFALATPLQAKAAEAFAPLGSPLKTYDGPVSNDQVGVTSSSTSMPTRRFAPVRTRKR